LEAVISAGKDVSESLTCDTTYLPDTSQSRETTSEENGSSAAKPVIEGNRQPVKISFDFS
jgi:hypothetical protein